jgi:UDP-N-acetylmuramate dehydrogenase
MTPLPIENDVPLAPLTTIRLGGPARYLARCGSVAELRMVLEFAREKSLPVTILGGGSNMIFADEGYRGLVVQPLLRGITMKEAGRDVFVTASAGETWDELVRQCTAKGYGGLECLSGIPGSAGAAPLQNIGAYGQEVSESITSVVVLDRISGRESTLEHDQCGFGYRQSIFKGAEKDHYIITSVTFRLRIAGEPEIRYAELRRLLDSRGQAKGVSPGESALTAVRDAVLTLRGGKSMVITPADPHCRSVGSFFMNPVLTKEAFDRLLKQVGTTEGNVTVQSFAAGGGIKVPAAWLVEHAGFPKGFRLGGVGVSDRHALALVNYGGTTTELLQLAEDIRTAVRTQFGIRLELEPVVIPAA